jgi:hypothetical protein
MLRRLFGAFATLLLATSGTAHAADYYFKIPVKVASPSSFQLFQTMPPLVHCYVTTAAGVPIKDWTSDSVTGNYSGVATVHIDTRGTDKTQKPGAYYCVLQIASDGSSYFEVDKYLETQPYGKSLMDGFVMPSGNVTRVTGTL